MNRAFLIIFFLISQLATAWGQNINWSPAKKIKCRELTLLTIDARDQLVCADTEGNLFQLQSNGDTINHYSPPTQASLQQLEISRSIQVFTFSEDLQRIEILDRFLQPLFSGRLDHSDIGWIKTACLGNNNVIWIFDAADLSLKQFNYQRKTILQNQPLALITQNPQWPVLGLIEHKNMLFLQVENKGIFLFDNQANYLDFIPLETNQKVSFYEDQIFYISEGKIISINIQSREKSSYSLPARDFEKIRIGAKKMAIFSQTEIQVYDFPFFH
ncbi:hypothetical protein QWY93_12690 [Echinicola jeungdonensis]|uniref:Uncharacterized protein n=1 Tax=Echinicola jeungdonensis TaxID=709343 RepID=A0ABV5JAM1_9BACT|nr:hypothetical protein [Echinicola jeungdonensis]MDN3670182.1 hypothetical protein [Echinicola jeungdonensis]